MYATAKHNITIDACDTVMISEILWLLTPAVSQSQIGSKQKTSKKKTRKRCATNLGSCRSTIESIFSTAMLAMKSTTTKRFELFLANILSMLSNM
jgi:hypothetical protein